MNSDRQITVSAVRRRTRRALSKLASVSLEKLSSFSGRKFRLGSYRAVFGIPSLTEREQDIVDKFSDLYYTKLDSGRGLHTIVLSWMGYQMLKCPMDLWIYQEILFSERPDIILEIGTYRGGSALYLATMCDMLGHGEIVTVDIDGSLQPERPVHSRITYILGSSIDADVFRRIKRMIGNRKVMVILDGEHHCDHVKQELKMYSALVKPGGYLIVEDTNINGHPTFPEFGFGPWEAVEDFLQVNDEYYADRSCERFLLTMNPRGFLRRKG